MAETAAGTALTQAFRAQQLRIRAATLAEILTVWPAFDIDDIDGTWGPVEAALIAIILRRRQASAGTAANYYRAFRTIEGVPGNAQPLIAPPPDRTLLTATLNLLGPIATKKTISLGKSNPLDIAFTRISGSAERFALNGGRETLTRTIDADDRAAGWRRVTSSSPCDFCDTLAGRGPIYKTDRTASFEAHDHCSCTSEPVYAA